MEVKDAPAYAPRMTSTPQTPVAPSQRHIPWVWLGIASLVLMGTLLSLRIANLPSIATASIRVVERGGLPVEGAMVTSDSLFGELRFLGVSDAEGRVPTDGLRGYGPMARIAGISLVVDILGHEGRPVALETETELVVPEVGRLEVSLVHADGTPYEDVSLPTMNIQVGLAMGGTWNATMLGHRVRHLDKDARSAFAPVAVGGKLRIRGFLQRLTIEKDIDGPTKSQEVRRIELRLPSVEEYLTGRIVDERGDPVIGEVGFSLQGDPGEGGRMMGWTLVTNQDGIFRFLVDSRFATEGEIQLNAVKIGSAKIDFKFDPANPVRDLGEVTLRATSG